MISSLWLWWQGYLTLRLQGPGLEQLLNQLGQAQIPLWNVERLTPDVVIARIPVGDFAKLRPLLWGWQIRVNILDRHGFPFVFTRLKVRAFWGLGLVLALLIMSYLSSFIWFIEVAGNEQISSAQLWEVLEEEGLKTGTPRKNLARRQLETALLTHFPDLVWVQISLQGVKVTINVAEREIRPGEEQWMGDIYALVDGLVSEILVLRGTPLVQVGDTVRKGDPLISGEYYDQRGRKQVGAARGVVLARTWHKGVGEASFTRWEPVPTGRRRLQFLFIIGPLSLPLGKSYSPSTHIVTKREWTLSLGTALLPFKWTKVEYLEVEYMPTTLPLETVRKIARDLAWENLLAQGIDPEKVRDERVDEANLADDEGIHLTLWVEVEEDIGKFFPQ